MITDRNTQSTHMALMVVVLVSIFARVMVIVLACRKEKKILCLSTSYK